MGKYKHGSYSDQDSVELNNIANELAETNRLKKLELQLFLLKAGVTGAKYDQLKEGFEDQA